jgi:hypothetical protein
MTWQRYSSRKTMNLHTALVSPFTAVCGISAVTQSAVTQPGTALLQLTGLLHVTAGSPPSCASQPVGRPAVSVATGTGNVRERNIVARSCNHCCSGKGITIAYSECVFVASVIQHAMHMRSIAISGLSHSIIFLHIISYTARF